MRLTSSTRNQGFTAQPPIPPSASFTTNAANEPEIGHAQYSVTGPIAGPLTPSAPLEILTSLRMETPNILPALQGRFAEHSYTLRLTQRAWYTLRVDLGCNAGLDSKYTALRITGPGFSIDEQARNVGFPFSGSMEPGTYFFMARARVAKQHRSRRRVDRHQVEDHAPAT